MRATLPVEARESDSGLAEESAAEPAWYQALSKACRHAHVLVRDEGNAGWCCAKCEYWLDDQQLLGGC